MWLMQGTSGPMSGSTLASPQAALIMGAQKIGSFLSVMTDVASQNRDLCRSKERLRRRTISFLVTYLCDILEELEDWGGSVES